MTCFCFRTGFLITASTKRTYFSGFSFLYMVVTNEKGAPYHLCSFSSTSMSFPKNHRSLIKDFEPNQRHQSVFLMKRLEVHTMLVYPVSIGQRTVVKSPTETSSSRRNRIKKKQKHEGPHIYCPLIPPKQERDLPCAFKELNCNRTVKGVWNKACRCQPRCCQHYTPSRHHQLLAVEHLGEVHMNTLLWCAAWHGSRLQ